MKQNLLIAGVSVILLSSCIRNEVIKPQPAGVREYNDLTYATVDGADLKLNLKLPADAGTRFPVIVFIHGGGWRIGSKDDPGGNVLVDKWQMVVDQGYAVANVNYRLSGQARFPAQIHDVKAAVRWIRANAATYNLDADRIGAWGLSAGGHLASLLGVTGAVASLEGTIGSTGYSSFVKAVVDWYGPVDPSKVVATKDINVEYYQAAGELLGEKLLEDYTAAEIQVVNPITYLDSGDPPFLIVHGDQDNVVPFSQSVELFDSLTTRGVPVVMDTVVGGMHGIGDDQMVERALQFFSGKL